MLSTWIQSPDFWYNMGIGVLIGMLFAYIFMAGQVRSLKSKLKELEKALYKDFKLMKSVSGRTANK
jgi:hypothetical protein